MSVCGPRHPDLLRELNDVCAPDPRVKFFAHSRDIGGQHLAVSQYSLRDEVPDAVRVSFDTVRNLYLYAYFVYRFYPVTKLQAFCCLEFALRVRYESDFPEDKRGTRSPTLRPLLQHAIEMGHVKNEGFSVWHRVTRLRAQERITMEQIEEMRRQGIEEMGFDDSTVQVLDVDRAYDYVSILVDTLPSLRNHYAHGTRSLDNQALGTIQIVSEIINQIYDPKL